MSNENECTMLKADFDAESVSIAESEEEARSLREELANLELSFHDRRVNNERKVGKLIGLNRMINPEVGNDEIEEMTDSFDKKASIKRKKTSQQFEADLEYGDGLEDDDEDEDL